MEQEIIVKWKIKETETLKVLSLLPQMFEKTRNEKGNVFYNIYQSVNDPNELILHERYADAEALEAHKKSAHYLETVVGLIAPHLETREIALVKKLF